MTVCDLSAITKPWEIEKRVADLVSSEFFEQGDMERQELNITPIDIMNREKEDQIPMMQVGFIDSICMPIYEVNDNSLKHKSIDYHFCYVSIKIGFC
jgi:dual 3',5'-cyclic-AMP and -GMP phosphodiesterase 11